MTKSGSLYESLAQSAEALRHCRKQLAKLETALLADDSMLIPSPYLQSIDLLDQRLSNLVFWLQGLSEGKSPDDLLPDISLIELRSTLSASVPQQDTSAKAHLF